MNVLILTPDAVGSTLLQRMLTIYMQFHEFDRPVINLHELTNGLAKYYSPDFNQELVGKRTVRNWGYHQTLQQIVELLSSVDHYKTSRLAHYHIRCRDDTIEQQIPFYNYLNENFFVIACRRTNVFEHALSMALNTITKKLNVYNAYEKIDTFYEMYQTGITLDPDVFVGQLDTYKEYINWSEQYFNIGSYFNYERDVPNLEQYILNLPVFSKQSNRVTWDNNFGISFNDWNKMHYARSDLTQWDRSNSLENSIPKKIESNASDYQTNILNGQLAVNNSTEECCSGATDQQRLQKLVQQEGIVPWLSQSKQQALSQYTQGYNQAQSTIAQMIKLGIIINGPPIKKQTLDEKRKIIKNFDTLIDLHNKWAQQNPDISSPVEHQAMLEKIQLEAAFWNLTTGPEHVLLPTQQ
jgi:hypothetical protein